MTLLERDTAAPTDGADAAAIRDLHETVSLQRAAFLRDPYPSLAERQEHLAALAGTVVANRDRIRAAMSADFAVHPGLFTDLVEVLGVAGRAQSAIEALPAWLADDERALDPALFGTAKASIRYQPKGVIGNIVPWNFPFDLSLGPLVEMLAAGNRVVIKPSDYTPACAELLREMLAATFDRDRVAVSVGGLELARTFPTLRWDHLLYTGSPAIGREVMKAAAENLVPVTLELGGKCPAVIADDAVDSRAVGGVLGGKLVKNGQMCISVDYALVPRQRMGDFVELAKQHMAEVLPGHAASEDNTGIITERHLDRIERLLAEARDAGYETVQLEESATVDRERRQVPLTLVLDPGDELGLMQEEIFGPILPVKPYDSLDEAIAYVNAGERPLALYVFTDDDAVAERTLTRTTSGGACVNTVAMHAALPSMGFGGIGQSGFGRHHGIEGFREFSNPRGVFVRGQDDLTDAFVPPYGPLAQAVVDGALGVDAE